jgi:hypothetical protein
MAPRNQKTSSTLCSEYWTRNFGILRRIFRFGISIAQNGYGCHTRLFRPVHVLLSRFYPNITLTLSTVFPRIVSFLEKFPTFNSFRGNYSIYEVKNCHNAETIWKFPHFQLSKKSTFRGNYTWKYGKKNWGKILEKFG